MEIPLTKTCRRCKKEFSKTPTISYSKWARRFCCSKECGDKSKKTPWLVQHQLKKGATLGLKTQFKKGHDLNEKNINWKGVEATYEAKHIWARNHFGRPQFCEHCKTSVHRMYHWANISGEFHRDRSDWLRLCVPCHKTFDLSTPKALHKRRVVLL